MTHVCNILFVFICVYNTSLCILSYDVPILSLLMYFIRNDKNKDEQSINHILCYIMQNLIWQLVWSRKSMINREDWLKINAA